MSSKGIFSNREQLHNELSELMDKYGLCDLIVFGTSHTQSVNLYISRGTDNKVFQVIYAELDNIVQELAPILKQLNKENGS
jgi:hypothetical protein